MAIDKQWALNCLRHNRNSALLTLASVSLLNSDAVNALRDSLVVITPTDLIFHASATDRAGVRFEIALSQAIDDYAIDRDNFVHSLGEFWRHARRNLLKESFEVVQGYCRATSRMVEFKAQPWQPFARLMRNCVSHDLHFTFRPYDVASLPISFLGVTIDSSLEGTAMRQDQLSPYMAIEIHRQMVAFVESY